jgi:hypothetical protein
MRLAMKFNFENSLLLILRIAILNSYVTFVLS